MEERRSRVVLLDNRHLDIVIQPKLTTDDLLHMVASHFMLREKRFFGLAFKDSVGQHLWLQSDRRVLEHELPRNQDLLVLHFLVRFFVESIASLEDIKTVEMFYLQAQSLISQDVYKSDCETVFQLAAYVLQESCGSYLDDSTTRAELRKLPVIPTSTLKEYPSITYCEDKIIGLYKQLSGLGRGYAIVNYMNIVESLPAYGVHFYDVKDKAGLPWWLGLGVKGIAVYDHNDRKTPRKEYPWKQLENIYFREKKFSIQVHDASSKRSGKSLSRRHTMTGGGSGSGSGGGGTATSLTVHSWFATSALLAKCIWSTAVSQHQFYIDIRHTNQLTLMRSMSDIADLLTSNGGSLSSMSQSGSLQSLPTSLPASAHSSRPELSADCSDSRSSHSDMYMALLERRQVLEQQLSRKIQQLRKVCLQEAELTGMLPAEYPATANESVPHLRRRVGTSFSLSPKLVHHQPLSKEASVMAQMEVEVELQEKITAAALRLARDRSRSRSIRKKRMQSFHKASEKLKQMEQKLQECRANAGLAAADVKPESSVEDLSEDSREFLDNTLSVAEAAVPVRSVSDDHLLSHSIRDDSVAASARLASDDMRNLTKSDDIDVNQCKHEVPENCIPSCWTFDDVSQRLRLDTGDTSEMIDRCLLPMMKSKSSDQCCQRHDVHLSSAASSTCDTQALGYVPSSVYKTRTRYRMQRFPTLSVHGHYGLADTDTGSLSNALDSIGVETHCDELCTHEANISAINSGTEELQINDRVDTMPCTYVHFSSGDDSSRFISDQSQCSSHAVSSRLVSESFDRYGNSQSLTSNFYSTSSHYSRVTGPAPTATDSADYMPARPCAINTSVSHSLTTVQQRQNVIEISKRFESSDVLRYSEKLRRQRLNNSVIAPAEFL